MTQINFNTEVPGELESVVEIVTEALKEEGFGILSRIDFHLKIKEKLGKNIPPVIILGACNPQLAYEAFLRTPDVASLLPCNAVVRQIGEGRCAIELAKPTALMRILGDEQLVELARGADQRLQNAIDKVRARAGARG